MRTFRSADLLAAGLPACSPKEVGIVMIIQNTNAVATTAHVGGFRDRAYVPASGTANR